VEELRVLGGQRTRLDQRGRLDLVGPDGVSGATPHLGGQRIGSTGELGLIYQQVEDPEVVGTLGVDEVGSHDQLVDHVDR
jgi:hypothetical protein